MSQFPGYVELVLCDYQQKMAEWASAADVTEIQEHLLASVGMVYPDDWESFKNLDYTKVTDTCQEIILAIKTVSHLGRTDLLELLRV